MGKPNEDAINAAADRGMLGAYWAAERLGASTSPSAVPDPEPTSLPPANTARSMPAEKCLPVEEITMARARPAALMPRMISGSSVQNAGIIELSLSGRFSCT